MSPREPKEPRQALVTNLLKKAHEQSKQSPERAPFWREGRLRCEFYKVDGRPRLKVFAGEVCVHEELVQGKPTAEERSDELRREYVHRPTGSEKKRK
jgi:hypothetical protein